MKRVILYHDAMIEYFGRSFRINFSGNIIAYEENGNFSFAFKFDWYLQSKKVFMFIVYNSIVVNTYTLRILAQNLINETTFPIYALLDTKETNGIELFFFTSGHYMRVIVQQITRQSKADSVS